MIKALRNLIPLIAALVITGYSPAAWGVFAEPLKPQTDAVFGPETEHKISEISVLSLEEAFERMKAVEFLVDESLSHKAIYKAFGRRKAGAVAYAAGRLAQPPFRKVNGKVERANDDYHVARKIFEVFPEDAVAEVASLYAEGDATLRGNIIRAVGSMAGGMPVRDLLVSALDDMTFYETGNPEAEGQALRICDLAYNQLVLRYRIKGVLRTIGTGYRTEIRDYHINILKAHLGF